MPFKLTPQQEQEVIKLYKSGKSSIAIGKIYSVHCSTILHTLERHGVKTRNPGSYSRNFTDKEEAKIAELYQMGWSAKSIAKMYGLNHHISIVDALERQGITQRDAPDRNRLYQLNPHAFDAINNEHAAYWLGFIYADGHVSKRSLTVSLKGADGHHLEKLKSFLQSEAIVKDSMNKCSNGKEYSRTTLVITDRHLTERLQELGISVGRPIPNYTFDQIPDSLFHHWLRGLFDGDGGAHRAMAISFCGDNRLMELVRGNLAKRIASNPGLAISKHNKANLYYLRFSGRNVAMNVINFMYQDATIWLDRKRQVIASWPVPQRLSRNTKGQYYVQT